MTPSSPWSPRGRVWRPLLQTLIVLLLVTSQTVLQSSGSARATSFSGHSGRKTVFGEETWAYWNANNFPVIVNNGSYPGNILLQEREVGIFARFHSGSSSSCVDSVFDWKFSYGHYDSRALRVCQDGFYTFYQPETVLGLQGEQKGGACLLAGKSHAAKHGTSVVNNHADKHNTRVLGHCNSTSTGMFGSGINENIQAGFYFDFAQRWTSIRIINGGVVTDLISNFPQNPNA